MDQSINHNWLIYMLAFACSFAISIYVTPMVKKLAFKVGAIDQPKDRGLHTKPMPLMGGLAIVLAFFITMILLMPFMHELRTKQMLGFYIGAAIIAILGIFDDIHDLPAKVKFPIQIIAAVIVVLTGTRFRPLIWPFSLVPGTFDAPLTILWIVGITNAVNFIDGVDGLAAGVASIASLILMVLCIISGSPLAIVLTSTLAGSCLGFLPRNFNPAEIFMGDTGSTFLGFVLAVSSIIGVFKSYAILSIIVCVLALAFPIFDTAYAILRRALNKKPIMQADRGHLHHRLIDAGFSQKQAVFVLYVVSLMCGLIAIAIAMQEPIALLVVVVALVILFVMLIVYRKSTVDMQDQKKKDAIKEENSKPIKKEDKDIDTNK